MDAGLCHAGGDGGKDRGRKESGTGKDLGRWRRIAENSPTRGNPMSIMPADARRDTTG
jgi:hypothetical protein